MSQQVLVAKDSERLSLIEKSLRGVLPGTPAIFSTKDYGEVTLYSNTQDGQTLFSYESTGPLRLVLIGARGEFLGGRIDYKLFDNETPGSDVEKALERAIIQMISQCNPITRK